MPVGRATPLVEPIECVATIEVTYPKVLGKLLFPDEPVPHWIVNPVELSRDLAKTEDNVIHASTA